MRATASWNDDILLSRVRLFSCSLSSSLSRRSGYAPDATALRVGLRGRDERPRCRDLLLRSLSCASSVSSSRQMYAAVAAAAAGDEDEGYLSGASTTDEEARKEESIAMPLDANVRVDNILRRQRSTSEEDAPRSAAKPRRKRKRLQHRSYGEDASGDRLYAAACVPGLELAAAAGHNPPTTFKVLPFLWAQACPVDVERVAPSDPASRDHNMERASSSPRRRLRSAVQPRHPELAHRSLRASERRENGPGLSSESGPRSSSESGPRSASEDNRCSGAKDASSAHSRAAPRRALPSRPIHKASLLRWRELGAAQLESRRLGSRQISQALQHTVVDDFRPWRTWGTASKDVITAVWAPTGRAFAVGASSNLDYSNIQYNDRRTLLYGKIEDNLIVELSTLR